MRAAVQHRFGDPPQFEEFPGPEPTPGGTILEARASPLAPLARSAAAGPHVASPTSLPAVAGRLPALLVGREVLLPLVVGNDDAFPFALEEARFANDTVRPVHHE